MNSLTGTISAIHSSNNLSIVSVDINGNIFSSLLLHSNENELDYQVGQAVSIIFKETEVGIAKNLSGQISFRNRFAGTIEHIEKGEVLSKITIKFYVYKIDSIISTRSTEDMNLKVGDPIEWLVKTNEVTLMRSNR